MCETNGTFNQKPHGCVSFASKYRLSQAHFAACHALASSYKSEKHPGINQKPHGCVSFASKYRLSQAHFAACHALASSYKSEKHPGKWSGIVSYISLSTKKIVGRRQNNSRSRENSNEA